MPQELLFQKLLNMELTSSAITPPLGTQRGASSVRGQPAYLKASRLHVGDKSERSHPDGHGSSLLCRRL